MEDKRFFSHKGIDIRALPRAVFKNVCRGKFLHGGSTITQQLVKNITFQSSKSLRRKVIEMYLARRVERRIPKKDVLELYLNSAYFGLGAQGIKQAARNFFGTSVGKLTPAQSILLTACLRLPLHKKGSKARFADTFRFARRYLAVANQYDPKLFNKNSRAELRTVIERIKRDYIEKSKVSKRARGSEVDEAY
jgi:membrane carboxypeptidase/penicillin-binding protein